jgi:RpiR family transcriptional regulator, carbohydrate utilization regulator
MTIADGLRPAPLSHGEVAARSATVLPSLVPSDRRVIDQVLADPQGVIGCSVSDIAERARTSASTVVRACQHLGYRGFQELRLSLARDLAGAANGDELTHPEGITGSTPPERILDTIFDVSSRALRDARRTIDPAAFALAVERIDSASRLVVIGNGGSTATAQDAAYRFCTLGLVVHAPADTIGQHLLARQLDSASVCLVFSHSGVTRETLKAAEAAKSRRATIIAVTSHLRSPLTDLADASLVAAASDRGFRLESMASRLAYLSIVDALFVGVAVSRTKRSAAALDVMADVTVEHTL